MLKYFFSTLLALVSVFVCEGLSPFPGTPFSAPEAVLTFSSCTFALVSLEAGGVATSTGASFGLVFSPAASLVIGTSTSFSSRS